MKQFNLWIAISGLSLTTSFLSCTKEEFSVSGKNENIHLVILVDEYGNPNPSTKGSRLPSGSTLNGTGYYADRDGCTFSYSPTSDYNSSCTWD